MIVIIPAPQCRQDNSFPPIGAFALCGSHTYDRCTESHRPFWRQLEPTTHCSGVELTVHFAPSHPTSYEVVCGDIALEAMLSRRYPIIFSGRSEGALADKHTRQSHSRRLRSISSHRRKGASRRSSAARPCCPIDADLPWAFTFVVTIQAPFPVLRRVAVLFRLFCALAVAIVTAYHFCCLGTHTCCLATAQASQPAAIYASSHQHAPAHANLSGGKCHNCTMVSLPAFSVVLAATDESTVCDAAPVRDLASFHPHLTSPPPKA